MSELIEMLFWLWTWVGQHVLHGAHWRHLANAIEPFVHDQLLFLIQVYSISCYFPLFVDAVHDMLCLQWLDTVGWTSGRGMWPVKTE